MKLWAISDLHLNHSANWQAMQALEPSRDDWLILGGDICDTVAQLDAVLAFLVPRFAQVVWVPGNHELWVGRQLSVAGQETSLEKYICLVEACRRFNVATPEDEYLVWDGPGGKHLIAPLHTFYDYSFRPDHIAEADAVAWAMESGVLCADEHLIQVHPFAHKRDWCHARVAYTQARLANCPRDLPLVLVNHFPLRYDLVRTMRIPRFSIWCGTRLTHNWHQKYNVNVVVSGHLHMRCTDFRDGVRFEEVSLGYPRDWQHSNGLRAYFREILPGPAAQYHHAGPFWKFRV